MSVEDSSPRSEAANAATRPRRIWTPAEDAILKALYLITVTQGARRAGGRTLPQACKIRLRRNMEPESRL
ncbi:unnamed protein product [Colletotrichum noveboracense]|uniref:Uncharacterized protein n=1 Tax=Colletotrichum noveboracense TaxID=2664923 RepID=A0A9W4RYX4_9PEZI|nr:unnamed protein product [Colletotrichum noveboracense]